MTKASKTGPAIQCSYSKLLPVAKLKPHPKNPNQHSDDQIKLLAKLIAHQGWRSPVVVSKRSGYIVAGHGRFAAAIQLGAKVVPVDFQAFANEADELAHLVADNRIAELSVTDSDALKVVVAELQAMEVDLDLTGFDTKAIETLMGAALPVHAPEAFQTVDENLKTQYKCPKCSYRWSGKQA